MPSSKNYKRNYKQEAATEDEDRKDKRRARMRARYKMGKKGSGDKRDVCHKDGNAKNNKKSNLKMCSRKKNRSYPRTKNAGKKNKRD